MTVLVFSFFFAGFELWQLVAFTSKRFLARKCKPNHGDTNCADFLVFRAAKADNRALGGFLIRLSLS